ncbi:LptF/LptG family permease [Candidatus Pelagibacter sp. HIMB1321]|uniref:LptF/LptG family permease n=1 Tax=Candidatus Pelagibacter sp. HIMB1321 TaxID=1388755 RepID=UPI000A07F139|nr:LptF/LptG family permease [Candidatus Pelagibacter sp. HIMB1321]SMF72420.1 lipopolysaccharide export system permease protein [Candidatus Pelagibacter sp. HIMB1321]
MRKKIFYKLLLDCISFFLISVLSASLIIWIVQAVNFLDIIIDDGRNISTYLKYTLSNLPKIIAKITPFIILLTLIYIFSKYEKKNELIIFWNFGINKIEVVNFFFYISIIVTILQILIVSIIVPYTQDYSRKIIKNSSINFIDSFIKTKKFNASLEGITLFNNSRDENGNLYDVYVKNGDINNFQIIFAKKGKVNVQNNQNFLELFDGRTLSYTNGNVSEFNFSKTRIVLNKFDSGAITHRKTQQVSTINLFRCYFQIYKQTTEVDLSEILNIENCKSENISNIIREFYKRLVIPLYIPVIILVSLLLILTSKEKKFYNRKILSIFFLGLIFLILSETNQRFISKNLYSNLIIISLPIIFTIILNIIFNIKLNLKEKINDSL